MKNMHFAQHTQKSAHSESDTKSKMANYPSLRGFTPTGKRAMQTKRLLSLTRLTADTKPLSSVNQQRACAILDAVNF